MQSNNVAMRKQDVRVQQLQYEILCTLVGYKRYAASYQRTPNITGQSRKEKVAFALAATQLTKTNIQPFPRRTCDFSY